MNLEGAQPGLRLSASSFERARRFVEEEARPIDRALFRHEFENGSPREVATALAAFQNDDGGFGNALEPDFRLPDSSAMATSVAFQVLREIGAEAARSAVKGGVAWLVEHFDPDRPGWPPAPSTLDDHPRAPWWSFAQLDVPTATSWGNPNAELVGVLLEHAALVPVGLAERALDIALERLDETPRPVGPYVALCFLRLAELAPTAARVKIVARLREDARDILDLDPEKLLGEHFPPYWLAPHPKAPLADLLADAVGWDLDRQIEAQQPNGCWEPPWSWGDAFPDAWARARAEWRGELTLRALRTLRDYGRIDPVTRGS